MKATAFQSIVASLLLVLGAQAAVRPHYGGTLRVEMRASVQLLSPSSNETNAAQERVSALVFEPLVALDANAQPRPALAFSWQHTPDYKLWQFWLRLAKFHDGSPLSVAQVLASLSAANPKPAWRARAEGESIIFESEVPLPTLPLQLAQQRNAIYSKTANGDPVGTGPFRVSEWQAGKHALLVANDEYWNGRPFLDAIEVAMDRPLRDQMISLELGRADLIEVEVDQARRLALPGRRIVTSAPVELFVIAFDQERRATQDPRLREAVALAIDRKAIHEVLLQRQGEPAFALLPHWISGYAMLFSTQRDLDRARQLRNQVRNPSLTLNYDSGDTLARSIAERIALNAQDAGLVVQPVGQNSSARNTADMRLARVRLLSPDPATALAGVLAVTGMGPQPVAGSSLEQIFRAEQAALDSFYAIPIAAVPEAYTLGARVRNWSQPRAGGWPLAWGEVWVETN
jgi:peptide/nickel transport system substrate-binding protein